MIHIGEVAMKMKNELMRRREEPPAAVRQPCQARQYSDQMVCRKCDLTWDVNDPEAPACK